ncbi:MAG: hypothetical protein ACR2RL_05115 [Gammaproteobacteria bacterium]
MSQTERLRPAAIAVMWTAWRGGFAGETSSAEMSPPRKPIDRFSWELLQILGDSLTQPRLNRDAFDLRVVATLSRKHHVRHLLFRDYRLEEQRWVATLADGTTLNFHDEATRYFYAHMTYRLALAPKPKQRPAEQHMTNMHRLFSLMCQHSASSQWRNVRTLRSLQRPARSSGHESFGAVSKALEQQREALEHKSLGELTLGRQRESGPLWLVLDDAAAEVPEQMSLLDVLNALPLPLSGSFSRDPDIQKFLTRVLDSVNERYALVRGCGLSLDPWLERNHPSIGVLRQLRALRRASSALMNSAAGTRPAQAHRLAFMELKGKQKKYAGVKTIEELMRTEYGAQMLGLGPLSLDALGEQDSGSQGSGSQGSGLLSDAAALSDSSSEMSVLERNSAMVEWFDSAVEARPRLFPPVMRALFWAVLVEERGIDELVADGGFRQLLDANGEFLGLDDSSLEAALRRKALEVVRSAKSSRLRAVTGR